MNKSEIEKRIMDMAEGKTYQEIADALNTEKIPTFSNKGSWNRGTVFKILKKVPIAEKTEPAKEPDKSDKDSPLRKAYQAVLRELDGALRDIGNLNQTISGMQAEIDQLKTEIRQLTQKEHYRQKDIDDMLNTALTQNQAMGNDGMLSEILNRLSAIEKRIGMIPKEKQSENIAGWSIQKDNRGFYRGFKHISGKVRGVYLGKDISDETAITLKLDQAYQKYAGDMQ